MRLSLTFIFTIFQYLFVIKIKYLKYFILYIKYFIQYKLISTVRNIVNHYFLHLIIIERNELNDILLYFEIIRFTV
jgi:hypothetical protein